MIAKRKRPFFLNLLIIRLPVSGVSSILHRISGVLLVVLLPLLLYGLDLSLRDRNGYAQVTDFLRSIPGRLLLLLALALFAQHFATGIRHLIFSIGIGLSLRVAVLSAWAALILTLAAILLFGLWIL